MALPQGAQALGDTALPVVDAPPIPGAVVLLRRGVAAEDDIEVVAVCAGAPSDRWAPGVEELVLARAGAIAQGALRGAVDRFDAGAIAASGPRFEQPFEGAVQRGATPLVFRGRHLLGFTSASREAVLCSVLCTEPPTASSRCAPVIDSLAATGTWTSAPPPSLAIRAILGTAEHPTAALAIAAALGLVLVVGIFAKRPRPRR
ncbi:MAG: hypothetical protein ABI134_20890 [Byssovorax sp.]